MVSYKNDTNSSYQLMSIFYETLYCVRGSWYCFLTRRNTFLYQLDPHAYACVLQILVFCTTAMVTRLVAELLNELNMNVREIHSRKPQSYRTRVSDEFRKSKGLILVTSDVSARGVDYPDVSLVVQVNILFEFSFTMNSTSIFTPGFSTGIKSQTQ